MIKIFWKKIALLAIVPLAIMYGFAYQVDKGLQQSHHRYYAEWNDLFLGKINADVLILGSSRAEYHISPKILDSMLHINSYNLGMSGWHFDMQYARYQLYRVHNKKPKTIILNVDLYGFAKRKDVVDPKQFLPYLQEPILRQTLAGHKGDFDWKDDYLPLYKYRGDLHLFFEGLYPVRQTDKYKGYIGNDLVWNKDFEAFKKKYSKKGVKYTLSPSFKKMLDGFAADCQREGIKLILLYAPEYYEVQPLYKNKQVFVDYWKATALKYKATFLDYTNDSLCFQRRYFYNSQHLNKHGSELFTAKLAHTMQAL